MNGYDAQDMAAQGADGFRNGYQAGYVDAVKAIEAAKPAAAQEAVAWFTDDHLSDKSATTYDPSVAERWRKKGWPVTALYAAPVAAAPADARSLALAVEQALGWRDGERDAELDSLLETAMSILDRNPAAPGIDLLNTAYFQGWVAASGWAGRNDLVADDGSKAYTDERDQRLHGLIDASPKGGSEARALLDALVSLVAVARRYLPDYDEHPEVQKADDAIDAAMQAQAGDAEVQP